MQSVGAVLGAGLFLLSLAPAAAWAHPHPIVLVRTSRVLIRADEPVLFQAVTKEMTGAVRFSFRVKTPVGQWTTIQGMSLRNDVTFRPVRNGTYWVEAVAEQRQKMAVSAPTAIYVGSRPKLAISAKSVGVGHAVTFIAQAQAVFHPQYQIWYRPRQGPWVAAGAFTPKSHISLQLANPGPYQAKVEVRSGQGPVVASSALAWSVYGAPAAIDLKSGRSVWVADGAETEALTATVVDSQGDVVTDYQGSGSLTDITANGAISQWGSDPGHLNAIVSGASIPLSFVQGVARVMLQAGTTAATDDLKASTTSANGPILSGSTTITAVPQVATAINLESTDTYLIANESGNPANYAANVMDQVGEPMLSGTYALTANIQGPGQFQDLTQGPDTVTVTGGNGPAAVTIYSIAGSLGPVTLSLSATGLKSATMTLPAILGGQPYQFGVSAAQTTLTPGQSTTLTLTQLTKTGGVSDPASLDNSGYVVSITTASGAQATGFALDGAAYTGSPMEFAVATGPNFFYAVSQPVTLTITSAPAATYTITVADADGLWKPSKPLTITVVS